MMDRLGKKISLILLLLILVPLGVQAGPLDFNGGVQNEHTYEEVIFISGEPIRLTGTYRLTPPRERKGMETVSYRFNLTGKTGGTDGEEVKLDRTVSYETELNPYLEIGQTTSKTQVKSYKETITIGSDSYRLEDYQFSKSDIIDSRPASDFYEGNIIGRKYYTINQDEGRVSIDMIGENLGYENFWGKTETQLIENTINVEVFDEAGGENEGLKSFTGSYSHQVSDSLVRSLKYSGDSNSFSTIDGGHLKTSNHSIVSSYNYKIGKKKGEIKLHQEMLPKVERLIVPKFRDVDGHWAEDDIKKLYSLDVFDDQSSVFSPDTPMNRMEFTKAVIRASDIRADYEEPRRRRRNDPEPEPYFEDTDVRDENYRYIKSGVDKDIIQGLSSDRFGPDENLTRAQAITILMRSLGYEDKAPNPGYVTSFADDARIPNWARDSIYMGREIGLIRGDSNNRVNPNEYLTRAEASSLVINYLEFLEKGLQKNYRDNILKFN